MSANDKRAATPKLTVAGPRTSPPREPYEGLELDRTSARPGAYTAFSLPSIYHGQAFTPPAAAIAAAVIEARQQRAAMRKDKPAYATREGSVPAQVIAHLHAHGGHLTFGEIAARFALRVTSVAATLAPAIAGGALIRFAVHARSAVSLPGYSPPADADQATAAQVEIARRLERPDSFKRPTAPPTKRAL